MKLEEARCLVASISNESLITPAGSSVSESTHIEGEIDLPRRALLFKHNIWLISMLVIRWLVHFACIRLVVSRVVRVDMARLP